MLDTETELDSQLPSSILDANLDSYLSNYTPFNDWLITRRYQYLRQFFQGRRCLEMGSAEGSGTPYLLDHFDKVTIVDGSKEAVDHVAEKLGSSKLRPVHSYFEDLDLGDEKFDTIVLAHVLEHVSTPRVTLKKAKQYLAPGGVIIADVPNGSSLHRQVGVEMGLLKEKTELNDADLSIGHQRVYTPDTFRDELIEAGLKIKKFGGMFVKVLSNAQTEKVFNAEQLEALFHVGAKNPEIAAEIFAIAQ
jgi:2-polyprenyl-3-methyl-5-hydroxy-6-metoxy-1,4-benzoquinol methylase